MDDLEQKIKLKLLQELIDKMGSADTDRLKPKDAVPEKGLGVEVQAKDPEALKEGLDKAKELVGQADMPTDEPSEDDEQRLLELLHDEDDKE